MLKRACLVPEAKEETITDTGDISHQNQLVSLQPTSRLLSMNQGRSVLLRPTYTLISLVVICCVIVVVFASDTLVRLP